MTGFGSSHKKHSKRTSATQRTLGTVASVSKLAAIGLVALASQASLALTWSIGGDSNLPIADIPRSARDLLLHPWQQGMQIGAPRSFSLFSRGLITFDEAVSRYIHDELKHPALSLRLVDSSAAFGLSGLSTGGKSTDVQFVAGGVPLCGYQVRAHELQDRSTFILGTLPVVDVNENPPSAQDWPDLQQSREKAIAAVLSQQDATDVRVALAEKCVHVASGHMVPVWRMDIRADGLPYRVLADDYEAIDLQKQYFDASGNGLAYEFNRSSGSAKEFPLTNLTGDGTMTSTNFQTVIPSPYQQANESSLNFNYSSTDPRFDEVQAFVHVNQHFDFFTALGLEWYGPKPLQLKLHVKPNGQINNALFTPGSQTDGSLPTIQIHDGDGIDLQNLISDGDVVSHEFGHYIIYRTLKTTDGESLVLHEGLADTFVFFRTGDACLGESICPKDGRMCIVPERCLRTADNTVSYKDATWTQWAGSRGRLGHLHGQVISGLMWDLRTKSGMAAGDVTKLLFKAVSYFKVDSGFCDFVGSLVTADKELFNGVNASRIRDYVSRRNMGSFLPDAVPACVTTTSASALDPSAATSTTTTSKTKSSGGWLGCGVISAANSPLSPGVASASILILVMIAPLLLALRPMPQASRRRIAHKRQVAKRFDGHG